MPLFGSRKNSKSEQVKKKEKEAAGAAGVEVGSRRGAPIKSLAQASNDLNEAMATISNLQEQVAALQRLNDELSGTTAASPRGLLRRDGGGVFSPWTRVRTAHRNRVKGGIATAASGSASATADLTTTTTTTSATLNAPATLDDAMKNLKQSQTTSMARLVVDTCAEASQKELLSFWSTGYFDLIEIIEKIGYQATSSLMTRDRIALLIKQLALLDVFTAVLNNSSGVSSLLQQQEEKLATILSTFLRTCIESSNHLLRAQMLQILSACMMFSSEARTLIVNDLHRRKRRKKEHFAQVVFESLFSAASLAASDDDEEKQEVEEGEEAKEEEEEEEEDDDDDENVEGDVPELLTSSLKFINALITTESNSKDRSALIIDLLTANSALLLSLLLTAERHIQRHHTPMDLSEFSLQVDAFVGLITNEVRLNSALIEAPPQSFTPVLCSLLLEAKTRGIVSAQEAQRMISVVIGVELKRTRKKVVSSVDLSMAAGAPPPPPAAPVAPPPVAPPPIDKAENDSLRLKCKKLRWASVARAAEPIEGRWFANEVQTRSTSPSHRQLLQVLFSKDNSIFGLLNSSSSGNPLHAKALCAIHRGDEGLKLRYETNAFVEGEGYAQVRRLLMLNKLFLQASAEVCQSEPLRHLLRLVLEVGIAMGNSNDVGFLMNDQTIKALRQTLAPRYRPHFSVAHFIALLLQIANIGSLAPVDMLKLRTEELKSLEAAVARVQPSLLRLQEEEEAVLDAFSRVSLAIDALSDEIDEQEKERRKLNLKQLEDDCAELRESVNRRARDAVPSVLSMFGGTGGDDEDEGDALVILRSLDSFVNLLSDCVCDLPSILNESAAAAAKRLQEEQQQATTNTPKQAATTLTGGTIGEGLLSQLNKAMRKGDFADALKARRRGLGETEDDDDSEDWT